MARIQFDLRAILFAVFCLSVLLAYFAQSKNYFTNILLTVLLANFAGAVTALIVTFLLRFPRDGSLRNPDLTSEVTGEKTDE